MRNKKVKQLRRVARQIGGANTPTIYNKAESSPPQFQAVKNTDGIIINYRKVVQGVPVVMVSGERFVLKRLKKLNQ